MEVRGSGGGECCVAQHGPHHNHSYYSPYDLSKMNRIMLRFRPIAPKPTPGGGQQPNAGAQNGGVKAGPGKGKKRANKGGGGGVGLVGKRRKSRSPDNDSKRSNGEEKCHVVTLPLLPETPDLGNLGRRSTPTWLSFGGEDNQTAPDVVVSSVMVEGVTDTWLDGNGLGRTDDERRRRLDDDTCPGFVSDRWNRVWWTNEAYRRMVIIGDHHDTWRREESSSVVVMVRLGMSEKVELPSGKLFPAFTCRVRVQYGKDGSHSITVPCDVWRLDGGGFAWRLDVKAALSLGL